MLNAFNRLSLTRQFSLMVMVVAVFGGLMAFILMGQAYISGAQSRARTIANLVEDVGTWSSRYKGMWVFNDGGDAARVGDFLDTVRLAGQMTGPQLTKVSSPPGLPGTSVVEAARSVGPAGGFHRKNPALIQRELSEVTNASGHSAKFRITSDKFMNPNNAPTRFELAAIERLRESGAPETVEIKGDRLLYARRLSVEKGCMSCHDTPEAAPAVVRALYPDARRGYGYRLGDVAGVISVSVPIVDGDSNLHDLLGPTAWGGIAAFVASILALLWFVRRAMISPLRQLSDYATRTSESDVADIDAQNLRISEADENSRNEVHRMTVAIKRLLRSLKVQRKY